MSQPARVYVASSWRNDLQPWVVQALRLEGLEVYDFRAPDPGGDTPGGFQWSDIDPAWTGWDARTFREQLDDPTAEHGFERDMGALRWCDACLLVLPCGRSAHLELGWAAGAGKRTAAYLVDGEPELMYRMVDDLLVGAAELASWARLLGRLGRPDATPAHHPHGDPLAAG